MIIDCYDNNINDNTNEFLEKISNGEDTTSFEIVDIVIPCDNPYGVISRVDSSSFVRIPTKQIISYSVEKDGIYENMEWLDQNGEKMYTGTHKRIIPKEAFVEAFDTYIARERKEQ